MDVVYFLGHGSAAHSLHEVARFFGSPAVAKRYFNGDVTCVAEMPALDKASCIVIELSPEVSYSPEKPGFAAEQKIFDRAAEACIPCVLIFTRRCANPPPYCRDLRSIRLAILPPPKVGIPVPQHHYSLRCARYIEESGRKRARKIAEEIRAICSK